LESKPLVEKEEFSPLSFTLAGKKLSSLAGLPTTASVAVADDEALLTVRKGSLQGLDFPGFQAKAPQAGQTLRLAGSGAYRTGPGGQELPTLPLAIPRVDEFGGLLSDSSRRESRGL